MAGEKRQRSRTRRVLRGVVLGLLGTVTAIVVLVVLAFCALFTAPGQNFARKLAVKEANGALMGQLALGGLKLSPGGWLRLSDVKLSDPQGRPVISAHALAVHVDPLAVVRHKIWVKDVELDQPQIRILTEPDGGSNLAEALAPRNPSTEEKPDAGPSQPWKIELDQLAIRDGLVDQRAGAEDPNALHVDGIQVTANALDVPGKLQAQLHARADLTSPKKTPFALDLAAHGTGYTLDDTLQIDTLHAAAGASTVDVTGGIGNHEGKAHVEARLDEKLGRALGAPLARDLVAHADASWKDDTATVDVRVPADKGEAHLHAAVKPQQKPMSYVAELDLGHFDPSLLVTSAPKSDLSLGLHADGHGTSPAEIVATLALKLGRSTVNGITVESGEVQAHVAHEVAQLSRLGLVLPGGALVGSGFASRDDLELVLGANIPDMAHFTANLGATPPFVGSAEGAVRVQGSPQDPAVEVALESPRIANPAMDFDLHNLHLNAKVPNARKPTVLSMHLATAEGHFQDFQLDAFGGDVNLDGRRFTALLQGTGKTPLTLRSEGELPERSQVVTVATLDLQLGEVEWMLAGPARIDVSKGARVDRLELVSQDQRIVVQGGLEGHQVDARVEVNRLDLAKLPKLVVPARLGLEGRVTARVDARGPTSDPKVSAHVEATGVANATIAKRTRGRVDAILDAELEHFHAKARGQISLEKNHVALDVDAPISTKLAASTPLSGHVKADGIDLDLLSQLTDQPPRTYTGRADLDVTLTGTYGKPQGRATMALHGVQAKGSPVLDGTVKLDLAQTAKLAADLRAGKGHLTAKAELPLPADPLRHPERLAKLRDTEGTVDVAVRDVDLDEWRLFAATPPDADGVITAHLAAKGSAQDPRGTLHLEVHQLAYGAYQNLDATADLAAADTVTARADLLLQKQPAARLDAKIARSLAMLIQHPNAMGQTPIDVKLDAGPLDLAKTEGAKVHKHRSGTLTAHATVAGTLDVPEVHARVEGKSISFARTALGDALAQIDYAKKTANVHATLPHFDLTASAQQDLGLAGVKAMNANAIPVNVRLQADHFDLATLSGLSDAARGLGGNLTADASVNGPIGDPTFRGHVDLENGKVTIAGFGDFKQATLKLDASNDEVKLSQLEVHADDGVMKLSLDAKRSNAKQFALTGQFHSSKFPIESDDQIVAYLAADAKLDGQLASADSLVNVRFSQVHADVPTLTRKPVQKLGENPDIMILGVTKKKKAASPHAERAQRELDRAVASAAANPADVEAASAGPTHQVRVGIFAPSDFWVRGDDLNLDLRATMGVRLSDDPDRPFEIIQPPGRHEASLVQVVRGKITVFGRRFDVPNNRPIKVTFGGGDPTNAQLDAQLVYNDRADNIVVNVKVDGPVTKPNPPQLSSDPAMDQSTLALLIATGHLQAKRGAGQVSATSQAGSVVGSFLAGQLQNTLAKKLPIDTISVETNDQGQIRAEAGKYITDKIYVGYTHNFQAADPGALEYQDENVNEFSLQYQLSRHWQLEAIGGEAQSGVDAIWQKDY